MNFYIYLIVKKYKNKLINFNATIEFLILSHNRVNVGTFLFIRDNLQCFLFQVSHYNDTTLIPYFLRAYL